MYACSAPEQLSTPSCSHDNTDTVYNYLVVLRHTAFKLSILVVLDITCVTIFVVR